MALVSNCLLLVMIPLLGAVSIHASSLARSDAAPAAVYVLFDPRGFEVFGTWGPRLVSYPVALAATARWGRGSVVVAPIDRQRLGQAFRHGRFVVLWTHGQDGMIVTSDFALVVPGRYGTKWREPGRYLYLMSRESDERLEVGDNLQLLYASACNGGPHTSEWQRRLAPAEVITFDRFSGGLEHLWWLFAHGPARLKAIR